MEIEQITFNNYLSSPFEPLSFKEMEDIHEQILTSADTKNEDFQEFWEETVHSAIYYLLFAQIGISCLKKKKWTKIILELLHMTV